MHGPPEDQKENPDSVGAEIGVQGIEALPKRVQRYGIAKRSALDIAEFIEDLGTHQVLAKRVGTCGDYLLFRHYYTVDEVRLHAASLCMKHLLCPLCAIRRGAKALKSYLDRWEVVRASNGALKPFLVTLTIKDGDDLASRMAHLYRAQRELWKRRQRGRGSCLDGVVGAVWSYEVKRGAGSGLWHPHLHMIAIAENQPDQDHISREWKVITGDSHVVDVRPIEQADPVSGFLEVFKYAVKFSDQPLEDTWHCYEVLKGKRLIGSAGLFRGVVVPEQLVDEPFDDLPYRSLFYRYLPGRGYDLKRRLNEAI